MIDVKLVEAFVLLMNTGSLTRAETLTGASKATLSRQISRLEETLGVQLLTRSTRRIAPTEAGKAFFAHCETLLADLSARLETAQTEAQSLSSGFAGRLSILADTHFSTSFVCQVVRLYVERYPEIECRVDVSGRNSSPGIDAVDCYVCSAPPDQPNLVAKLLGRLNASLYASPAYLAQHGVPGHPSELSVHKLVELSEPGSRLSQRLHSTDRWYDVVPKSVMKTNDYWVMKTFCMEGLGVAVLPDFFTKPEVDGKLLVPLLPQWHPQPMRIYCAYQKQRYAGQKLRAFITLMSESVHDIASFHSYVGSSGKAAKK